MNRRLIYWFLLLTTSLQTALSQTVSLDSGLVAYYPFNGNANDESNNGNHGTVRFDAILTTDRFGAANGAFSFDGSNDDIMIPENGTLDLSGTLSISLWFYVDSNFATWQTLLSKGNHLNENYALYYKSSGDLYQYSLVDGVRRNYSIPTNSIRIQTWHHVVARFNGSKAEIFFDGEKAAEVEWEGNLTPNDDPLYIGTVGGRYDFDGKVDDIRIYNRALNDVEINQLYVEGTIQLQKPEDLTSQVLGFDQIELSWTDTNQSEDGYEIWRSEGNDPDFKLITLTSANDTRFIDTDLAENTTYFYRIKATSPLVDDSQFTEVIQSTTLPKVALDSGLIAYYPFNGNATDESGNGNDGTSFGAELTRDRFGNLNSAYLFDGIDDYIAADPIHLERRQSLVAWIKPAEGYNANGQVIIENRDNLSITDYALFIDKGNNLVEPRYFLRKADGDDGPSIKSNKSFEEEQWLLLIGIYDGQSSSIYVNGQLQGEPTLFTDDLRQLGTSFRIGDDTGNNAPFKGIIDDVRVYNRALNEEEITSIYDNGGYQKNDAALIDFDLDDGDHVAEGIHPIKVLLKNVGSAVLNSVTVNWTINGMAQPPLDWNGSLDLLDTAYVTLGDVDFQSAIIYTIEARVTAANDGNSLNNGALVKDLLVVPTGPNYALDFNGDYDFLVVSEKSEDFNVQNLTVEAWLKPERLSNWSSALIKSTRGWGDGFGLTHYTSGNDIRFFVNSYSNVNVRGFLELDKWQHVAGSYDGQFLRLFINGKQVDSLAYNAEIEHSETDLLIGNAPERNYHWEGGIDEVRVWNIARTPAQIKEFSVKNAKLIGQPGLIAAWHFGENIGNKTFDIASGKPAVFEGKPAWVQSEAPIGDNRSNNDAGILAINSPQNTGFEKGEKEVVVTLQNYGALPLTISTINWSVNEQLQRAFTWNGVLLPYQRDTVAIGRFNFSDGKPYALKAWTSGPNGLQDESTFNDSTEVLTVYAGLAGTYTIGGLNPDFETLTEAVDALNNGGISDAVTFDIRSGVYDEKVSIKAFEGTDCTRKVIFQSETGNRDDVIIKSTSTAEDNYIIQINGSNGIVIKNLTLQSEGNDRYGGVIDLVDSLGCITIFNNHLIGVPTTDTDASLAVISMLSGETPEGSITLSSNLVENGSFGTNLRNPSPRSVHYQVSKNEFVNQSLRGIGIHDLESVQITGNHISDRGIETNYDGIYVYDCDENLQITDNEIRIRYGEHGIYFSRSTPPDGNHSLIANNFVSLSSPNDAVGIFLSESNRAKVFHNTIHLLEGDESSSAFRIWNRSSNSFDIDLKNNILVNKGQGYSLRSRIWNDTFTSDFNVLLSEGEFLATSFGGDFATLADWQTRYSSQDQNSISIDPLFLSDTAYVVTNPLLNNLGTVLSQVPTDIEGKPRNAINPDVGVVEFESPPNDVGIVTFVAPGSENCNLSDSVTVAVELLNFSGQPQSRFNLNYRIGNGFPVVESLPDSVVMLPGERYTYPFVQKANLSDLGQFRIKATVLVDGDENYANDTLSLKVRNFLPVEAVNNLLPADSSSFNELPVVFSWSPAANATHYDLYIWRVSETKPTEPTVAGIPSIRYTLRDQLEHGTAYYWQIVAKNVCSEEPSAIQMLVTRDLPDLVVDVIEVQGSPFSGKEVPVSWTIKNNGLGATGTTQWFDALYLSNDPALSDEIGLNANGRDIYLGAFPNSSALQPGESYKNSTTLNLPRNTVGDRYLLVISDFYRQIQETDSRNNLSFSEPPMDVQLTPPPDLRVSSVTVPTIPVFSSRTYPISWEVVNTGTNPTQTDNWKDRIYLSNSEELNPVGATILADIEHTGQLEAGGGYTANAEITLPQGIDGEYYIFVHTNINRKVFEHTYTDNNTGRSDSLEVVLLPPPDLIVKEVAMPDSASSNQSIEVSWEVQNVGAGDSDADSWTDAIFISEDTILSTNSAVLLGAFSRTGGLKKDSLYTQTATVRLPDDMKGGAYFLHVLSDRENQVFEFDRESNNSAASPKTLSLGVPDLVVNDINVPPLLSSGNPITVNYTLKNNGPGHLLATDFIDRIYLSPQPDSNDPNALPLGRLTNNGITLLRDSIMRLTRTFMLPEGLEGSYYLGIHTDANDEVFEDFRDFNNSSYTGNTVNISLSPSPDLQVQTLEYAPEKQAGDTLIVRYTIQNNGLGDVIGESWQDNLYIADSTTWINGGARLLNQQVMSQVLPTGGSYEQEVTVTLPTDLETGTYYLYLETNVNDAVYEHAGAKDNNVQIGDSITIGAYPDIDLQVVTAEASVNGPRAGERLSVSYSVANRSEIDAVFAFRDALYLSADTVLEKDVDIRLQTSEARPSLPGKATYENSLWASLPNGVGGEFFLLFVTDDENSNSDSNPGNNVRLVTISTNGQAENRAVSIHAPPPPDLLITSFNAPASGIAGQPIDLTFTITNRGDSTTVPNNWRESVYLAADAQGKTGRLPLGTRNSKESLAVGESYSDSLTVTLPISAQGNYFLIMETDAGNRVFEGAMEGNNRVATGFNVIRPPVSDLVVDQIFGPDSAYAGESIQIQWAVTNIGANPGRGVMQDAVYLSKDTRLSDDDLRLGVRTRSTNLAPLSTYSDSLTARIGSLQEGNYFVLVATDVRNNIYESEETNNLTSIISPLHIRLTALPIETLFSDSLFHRTEKYLKFDVPPSLRGESLTLQLRSESTNAFNEAYIRYGEAATRTNYDFVYTSPFRKDQNVIIPELDTGTYYITLYANSENSVDQAITLFADVLEFELRDINAEQGGNTGRVTVKIEGSKFEQGIRARLEKDGQRLEAASVFRRDPTVIFATFNLSGASLGLYDVVLENLDGETVSRETAFAVVEGSAGVTVATGGRSAEGEGNICCVYATGTDNILDVEIEHPSAVRPNRIYDIIIEFTNTGNIDLPIPNRMLVSLDGAPIAFNSSDLEKGLLELFLEFEEDSGPFKTFRPGATKKFIIYTLSTPQGLNRRTRGVRIRFRLIE